jgi:hypothetical protein
MAYEAPDMVNNVAWFRPAGFSPFASSGSGGGGGGGGGTHGRSASIAAEWNEYAANAKGTGQGKREDWMVCAAGRELRALRVA